MATAGDAVALRWSTFALSSTEWSLLYTQYVHMAQHLPNAQIAS